MKYTHDRNTFYYGTPQLRKKSVNRYTCTYIMGFFIKPFFHYTVIYGTFSCVGSIYETFWSLLNPNDGFVYHLVGLLHVYTYHYVYTVH